MKRHNELAWRISQGIYIAICIVCIGFMGHLLWAVISDHARSSSFFTFRAIFEIMFPMAGLCMMTIMLTLLTGIGARTQRRRIILTIMFMISALSWCMSLLLQVVLSYANLYP